MHALGRLLLVAGAIVLVYFVTPWVARLVLTWIHVEHAEQVYLGVAILAIIGVYHVLRAILRDRMPRI